MTHPWYYYCCCWMLLSLLLIIQSHLAGGVVEERTEVMMPGAAAAAATLSPPEGNTTFLDGTTWCVAVVGVSHVDVQNALDWACGMGQADCRPIQNGGPCYQPDNILLHASYAFNSYYQQNGNSDVACNFGGTAAITKHDPSYEKCSFATSGRSTTSGVAKLLAYTWWKFTSIIILFYLRR
ncbi:hypothetical protein V2J09_018675 [Rumex salicifolius]